MEKPVPLAAFDFTNLIEQVTAYIDFVNSSDYHGDSDHRHYIFEEAVQAIYGKDIFKFINSKS